MNGNNKRLVQKSRYNLVHVVQWTFLDLLYIYGDVATFPVGSTAATFAGDVATLPVGVSVSCNSWRGYISGCNRPYIVQY